MNKVNLQADILHTVTQTEGLTPMDMLSLDSCLAATQKELSPEGIEIINECVQRIRDSVNGYTRAEINWFNNIK